MRVDHTRNSLILFLFVWFTFSIHQFDWLCTTIRGFYAYAFTSQTHITAFYWTINSISLCSIHLERSSYALAMRASRRILVCWYPLEISPYRSLLFLYLSLSHLMIMRRFIFSGAYTRRGRISASLRSIQLYLSAFLHYIEPIIHSLFTLTLFGSSGKRGHPRLASSSRLTSPLSPHV